MSLFGCASDEQFRDELAQEISERPWYPCDDCELTYINQCSSCSFASPSINDSLNYGDEG